MTGIMCALVGSGSIYAGSATVTVGFLSGGTFSSYGFQLGAQGSISPSTWGNSGLAFDTLKDVYSSGSPVWLDFTVAGSAPNSSWSTININGTIFNRVDAFYSTGGGKTSWLWYGAPAVFGTTVGATRAVAWS